MSASSTVDVKSTTAAAAIPVSTPKKVDIEYLVGYSVDYPIPLHQKNRARTFVDGIRVHGHDVPRTRIDAIGKTPMTKKNGMKFDELLRLAILSLEETKPTRDDVCVDRAELTEVPYNDWCIMTLDLRVSKRLDVLLTDLAGSIDQEVKMAWCSSVLTRTVTALYVKEAVFTDPVHAKSTSAAAEAMVVTPPTKTEIEYLVGYNAHYTIEAQYEQRARVFAHGIRVYGPDATRTLIDVVGKTPAAKKGNEANIFESIRRAKKSLRDAKLTRDDVCIDRANLSPVEYLPVGAETSEHWCVMILDLRVSKRLDVLLTELTCDIEHEDRMAWCSTVLAPTVTELYLKEGVFDQPARKASRLDAFYEQEVLGELASPEKVSKKPVYAKPANMDSIMDPRIYAQEILGAEFIPSENVPVCPHSIIDHQMYEQEIMGTAAGSSSDTSMAAVTSPAPSGDIDQLTPQDKADVLWNWSCKMRDKYNQPLRYAPAKRYKSLFVDLLMSAAAASSLSTASSVALSAAADDTKGREPLLGVYVRQRPAEVSTPDKPAKGFVGYSISHLITPQVQARAKALLDSVCTYSSLSIPMKLDAKSNPPPTIEDYHLRMGHGFTTPESLHRANRMLALSMTPRDFVNLEYNADTKEPKMAVVASGQSYMVVVKLNVTEDVRSLFKAIRDIAELTNEVLSNKALKPRVTVLYANKPVRKEGVPELPTRIPEDF